MKYLFGFLIMLAAGNVSAQQLNYAEYFFDTDPGAGQGIAVPLGAAADSVSGNIAVNVSALTPGFHILYFRTRNTSGVWSFPQGRKFYIAGQLPETAAKIAGANFYFDTDPGTGGGIHQPLAAADSVTGTASISVAGLAPGFHRLYARVKDTAGKWSFSKTVEFFIDGTPAISTAKIVSGEYFFDTDPGYGNGTFLSTGSAADSLSLSPTLLLDSLTPGFHRVYLRVRDSNGLWSNYGVGQLYKEAASPGLSAGIKAAEYFLGADPGAGNGTPVLPGFAIADSININCQVATAGLPLGDDTLYLRVQDSTGLWSFYKAASFRIENPAGIIDQADLQRDIVVQPNPVSDALNIYSESVAGEAVFEIRTVEGNFVQRLTGFIGSGKPVLVPVAGLPSGTYVLITSVNHRQFRGSFIKL